MLSVRVLYESPLLTVRDVECSGEHGRGTSEEATLDHAVAFVRRGVFQRRDRFGCHVADSTRALLFNRGMPYTIDHPDRCGDRCTSLGFRGDAVREAVRVRGRRGEPEAPFAGGGVVLGPALQLESRRLLCALGDGEPLRAEELALRILDQVTRIDCDSRQGERPERASAGLALRAQKLLAAEFREPLTLDTIAIRLGVSPFHLCRLFRLEVGRSLHAHLTELRLNEALELLPRYRERLSRLALHVGFSSHSHFTQAFRRHFGVPPSQALV